MTARFLLGNVAVALLLAACNGEVVESNASATDHTPHDAAAHKGDEIAYYTCAMHPSVRSADPGNCPICGMELTAVTRREADSGVIIIDAARRQTIGLTTEPAIRRPFSATIRTAGRITYDESRLTDVTLKLRGWIGELYVDSPGQHVEKGETLFTLYSPELYAAQQELLSAAASQANARQGNAPRRADYLIDAARRRLRLWDISDAHIRRILATGTASERVPIAAPASGHVVEKNVVAGATVEPGARLYRIADLDRVWVEADVYESDLPLLAPGDPVTVRMPYTPGGTLEGEIAFVYPYLDGATRTGRIRAEIANPELALRPDMYVDVEIEKQLGEALVVPSDAVLYAGERQFVFLDLGEGRLAPRSIQIGRKSGDWIEVLDGIEAGDSVVTSGNFLVAAESRLKLDMEHWK